jgi:hypothetical protein
MVAVVIEIPDLCRDRPLAVDRLMIRMRSWNQALIVRSKDRARKRELVDFFSLQASASG